MGSRHKLFSAQAAMAVAVFAFAGPIPCAIASSSTASAPGHLTAVAAIDISMKVPKVMRLRLIGHPAVIEVTDADLKQGRVTVAGTSLDVLSNDRRGYVLQAQVSNSAFTAVRIANLQSDCESFNGGCVARLPSMVGQAKPGPVPVSYELELATDAVPGRYPWPVALSLQDP